ncbi:uncharacterized protein LOC133186431 [Saccostrea echinata]|uniref:uncharacterized protein LOC133186431 n=1 Tax=Saccostrea echinata TaxID=191078 RepID=UPI002A822ADC|nr:uncharacterized protein LOC133186431 [Saccostrea echinata]
MMAEKRHCEGRTGDKGNDIKRKQLKTNNSAGTRSDISDDTSTCSKSDITEHQSGHEDRPLTPDPLSDLTENQRVVLYTLNLCYVGNDYHSIDLDDDDDVSMGDIDVRKTLEELEDRGLLYVRESYHMHGTRYCIPFGRQYEIEESYKQNCLLSDIDKDFLIHVASDLSLRRYITESRILNRDVSSPQASSSITLMRLMTEGRMAAVLQVMRDFAAYVRCHERFSNIFQLLRQTLV